MAHPEQHPSQASGSRQPGSPSPDPGLLAINGGPKVRTRPMPARALFGEDEKAAAVALFDEAIRSGNAFGYCGPEEEAYCREFAEYHGGGYADAVNSGSSAVYVALRAVGVEPFTEVICPSMTDPGGIMPAALLNCIPVPADTAPGCYNVGPEQIEERLTPLTSAIVVAHLVGEPADMDPILEIARARKIPVVEDCAQAHGARYKGRLCGTMGDVAAFSTMFGKLHATGGQGGVVYTRSEETYRRARWASDRGKPFGIPGATSNVVAAPNLNLNDLSAAIGRVQLRKLDGIASARREVARAILAGLRERSHVVSPGWLPDGSDPSYWFLRLHVDESRISVDPDAFAAALGAEGFPITASYRGAYQTNATWLVEHRAFGSGHYPWSAPEYRGDRHRAFPCPNAEAVLRGDFHLGIHERWGAEEVADFLTAVEKVEGAFRR